MGLIGLVGLMCGCAGVRPAPRVDTAAAGARVVAASRSATAAGVAAARVGNSVASARAAARAIEARAGTVLKPETAATKQDLSEALSWVQGIAKGQAAELEKAGAQTDDLKGALCDVSIELSGARTEMEALQKRADALARDYAAQSAQLERASNELGQALVDRNAARVESAKLRMKLWEWRAAALVILLAVAGFVFRRPIGALLGVPVP